MKPWMTAPQLAWLRQQLPRWQTACDSKRVREFLEGVATKFFKQFPIPQSDRAAYSEVSLFL